MKRRIGILTAGGDCPGLNACIRGVARASYSLFDTEIVGIQDGYAGLIEGDYKEMKQSDFSGILTLGGTILGTRRTPFSEMRVIDHIGVNNDGESVAGIGDLLNGDVAVGHGTECEVEKNRRFFDVFWNE